MSVCDSVCRICVVREFDRVDLYLVMAHKKGMCCYWMLSPNLKTKTLPSSHTNHCVTSPPSDSSLSGSRIQGWEEGVETEKEVVAELRAVQVT
jgi:hypothetical protein